MPLKGPTSLPAERGECIHEQTAARHRRWESHPGAESDSSTAKMVMQMNCSEEQTYKVTIAKPQVTGQGQETGGGKAQLPQVLVHKAIKHVYFITTVHSFSVKLS